MTHTDEKIDAALTAEERDLLRRIGEEPPGHIEQLTGLLGERDGWVSLVLLLAQSTLFVGGVWAGWNFFQADDALTALHWGLPSATLILMALMLKLALWPAMHAHRLRLAVKRLELLLGTFGRG